MVEFQNSVTKENLMRAFAGESQARNRYTFAASAAKKANLHVVEQAFLFTAGQEKEHAEIFYNFLKPVAGDTITVDGGYPVDLADDVATLLRMAEHNEYEEAVSVYVGFAQVARSEGFENIALAFEQIAKIEKTHGERFARLAQLMEAGELFDSKGQETVWMCLNCGHIHNGPKPPMVCPACHHDQGYFIRWTMAPFGE